MSAQNREDQISLKELFLELSRDVKDGHLRIEAKMDHLHECFETRDKNVWEELNIHKGKLEKHEHTFSLFQHILTGFGIVVGIATSLWGLMPWVDKSPK